MSRIAADYMAESLAQAGVKRIYGVVGDSLNGFTDALVNPNFAAMAQSMGIKGVRVEAPEDVHAAVEEVLAHDGPALLDVVSARQELVMPPTTTFGEARKFGVFMLKAVLDGRAGELVDLAKVNLLR
jgi:pyruvate dehydrogenase (quinone)